MAIHETLLQSTGAEAMIHDPDKRPASSDMDPNSQISRKLRELYQSVHDERIPDRFLDLLEKLDKAEESNAPANKHRE